MAKLAAAAPKAIAGTHPLAQQRCSPQTTGPLLCHSNEHHTGAQAHDTIELLQHVCTLAVQLRCQVLHDQSLPASQCHHETAEHLRA